MMSKLMNKLKVVFLTLLIGLFLLSAVVGLLFPGSFYSLNENFFYWIELAALIYIVWSVKIESGFFLYSGLILVSFGAIINILGVGFAEQIFRSSMAFWIVGIAISLRELKK